MPVTVPVIVPITVPVTVPVAAEPRNSSSVAQWDTLNF